MDTDVELLRRVLVLQASDTSSGKEALGALHRIEAELQRARKTDGRLEDLTESLFALAVLDFSKQPTLAHDGSMLDAASSCVTMLSEELSAHLDERSHAEQQLEERVRERTSQLQQAGKMAAVGQLAAGIAHEINNPLAVILGFAQGLERRLLTTSPELKLPVTSIIREALRCKKLVEELLTFSRVDRRVREPLQLQALVSNAAPLLQVRARTQDTTLTLELPETVAPVIGNRTQLEQVLINLGINALDALEHGGNIVFRVRPSGPSHVAVAVSDDGPGIPDEVRSRIFEPFFTTKPVGKGTGLGLSLSYEIVQQHGGSFDVDTALGRGTTMTVRLPVAPP